MEKAINTDLQNSENDSEYYGTGSIHGDNLIYQTRNIHPNTKMYSDYDYFQDEQLCKKFNQKVEVQEQPKKDNHEDSIENKPNYESFSKYENDLEKFIFKKIQIAM